MSPDEIVHLAADGDGALFCADGAGRIGRIGPRGIVVVAELPPIAGATALAARLGALAGRARGGCLATDTALGALWAIDGDGRLARIAGRESGARRSVVDAPRLDAGLRAPGAVAELDAAIYLVDERNGACVLRRIAGDRVETLDPRGLPPRVTAIAGRGGYLYLVDGASPRFALYRLVPGGDVVVAAGSPAEPGGDDGSASAARFARLLAIACGDDGSCFVADGARVRRFDGRRVETLAGSAPGFADGAGVAARFGAIRAIACVREKLYVADGENRAVRVIVSGTAETLDLEGAALDATTANGATLDEATAQRLARELGLAIVDDDVVAATPLVDAFLADARRRGVARPDRRFLPVSVASARVGRELASTWMLSADAARSRLGAFCLWLLRSEEATAPRSDAERLAEALAASLAARDVTRAAALAESLEIAFPAKRPRNAGAVRRALASVEVASPLARLLESGGDDARRVAVAIARRTGDARLTTALAAIALERGPFSTAAAEALRAIWSRPRVARSERAEVAEGLRFARDLLERLRASDLLDDRARRRIAALLRE